MPKFARIPPSVLRMPSGDGSYFMEVPEPGRAYDDNDPMVKAHPDAFVTAEEAAEANAPERFPESVPIESATRAPGEKRSTRRK